MAISFTSQGANPFSIPSQGISGSSPTTNKSTTLGQIHSAMTSNNNRALGLPSAGTAAPQASPAANALNSVASPTTPVKRQTVTNTDGSSTSTEYHAPTSPSSPSTGTQGSSAGVLPAATSQPLAQATLPTPAAYNPNGGVTDTVYNNGVGTTYQGGQAVTGYTAPTPGLTPQPVQNTNQPATFPGIVSNLANTAQNGSANATQATTGLLGAPAQNAQIGQNAQDIANTYGQKIADVGSQGAKFEGGQLTTGTSPVAEGNAAVTANTTANQQQALATGEEAALQGIGYQLTGQNQGQEGLTNAGSIANTQQANTQSGLANAGTLVSPVQVPYSNQYVSPTTGTAINPQAGASEQSAVALEAGKVRNNQETLAQAENNLVNYSQPGLNDLNSALGAGFNANTNAGAASGQAAVAGAADTGAATGIAATAAAPGQISAANQTTAGTAETNTLAQVYGQNAPAAYTLNTALNNIQSLGSLTLQNAQGGDINPLSTQVGNQTIAQFKNGLGSASQATFNSNMAAFGSSLSALYADQSGATPTQVGTWATQIANGSMPMQQLQAIYNASISEGNLRLNNLKSTASSAYSGLQNSASTSNTNSNASSNPTGWF